MSVSSLNASSVDVQAIVSQLMALERRPVDKLNQKSASYETKLTVFSSIKNTISTFQDSVKALKGAGSFQSYKVNSADPTVFSATAGSNAVPGNYSLEISSLARSQQLVAAGQISSSTAIGSGVSTTLSFDFGEISGGTFDTNTGTYTGASFASNGGGVQTVTIDNTNNTLEGIRDAVNDANIGVTATIVNDGGASPYRLAFSSATSGESNSMSISVAGDAALDSLLSNDPTGGQNLSETLTAQNANFTLNGVAITKSSNTVSDAIQGVTLNLNKVSSGPVNLTVSKDTAAIVEAANSFITAYNDLNSTFKSVSAYGTGGSGGGTLAGDPAIRQMLDELRGIISSTVSGGAFATLASVGITTKVGVGLALDTAVFNDAIDSNLADLSNLFTSETGFATQFDAWATKSLNITIGTRTTNITDSISAIAKQVELREVRLVSIEKRFTAQFSNLNRVLASLSSQQLFITQSFSSNNS